MDFLHLAWPHFHFYGLKASLDSFVLSVVNFNTSLDEENGETTEETDGDSKQKMEKRDELEGKDSSSTSSELPDSKEEL